MFISNVTEKGAIVIPAPLRKKYNISPSQKIEIVDSEQGLLLIPIPENIVDTLYGFLKNDKKLVKELIKEKQSEKKKEEQKWQNTP
jgi:AbrB family looped-hinge helix DNA binding protein